MTVGADDDGNPVAGELRRGTFVNGNYGAFGHAAC